MQVKNKRVVVTGAASGIGKALAVAFKKAGALSIVAVDINIEGAEETAKNIDGIAVKANVGQESDILNVIEKGTAQNSKIRDIEIVGKTGTAENFTKINGIRRQLTDHSIFIGFAPKDISGTERRRVRATFLTYSSLFG